MSKNGRANLIDFLPVSMYPDSNLFGTGKRRSIYIMKILFIYPRYPDTFWSFKHALKFISRKAAFPPLGLLTVASILPENWPKKLVDMNVTNLADRDIEWADYIFVSAMAVQRSSALDIIKRSRNLGVRVVAGGPLFTSSHEEFDEIVDHFVLNEAEKTLPPFLEDLKNGCPKHIYTSKQFPDLRTSPVPLWHLINMRDYSAMSIQYSRGCPFDCEFCDITVLNGRVPRTKDKEQFLKELDALHDMDWRGSVFVVDDNFIGNKKKLKAEILPSIASWMRRKKYPFSLLTQVSVNLADDEELIRLMVEANFHSVFVGIETTNEESLAECGKVQNRNRDLVQSVKRMQRHGLQVQGGFIVGFDHDPPSTFENLVNFIQKSGIVTAMVGLLNVPPGTKLYKRLKKERRLVAGFTGDNTDCSANFIPKMGYNALISGYKKVINTIYSHKHFYERIKTFLEEYEPPKLRLRSPGFKHFKAFFKSIWIMGIKEKGRKYYWKLLTWTLFRRPRFLSLSVTLAIYGFHFRHVVNAYLAPTHKTTG